MSATAATDAPTGLLIIPPNFIESARSRIFHEISTHAEQWSKIAGEVGLYPWTHFAESPRPEDLRKHRTALETLIAFGELLNITTSLPTFPDNEIAAGVTATLRLLKDDLAMWHGSDLSDAQAEELLQKCFPE